LIGSVVAWLLLTSIIKSEANLRQRFSIGTDRWNRHVGC
jgi:hypothetical protein